MSLATYLDRAATGSDAGYLSRWRLYPKLLELRADYSRPLHFRCWTESLSPVLDPQWRWLYLGPAGTGTAWHVDFLGTSAWNMLCAGEKKWFFCPPSPNVPAEEADVWSCVQTPGDIVFTPALWWHTVENLSATLSLTENFCNEFNYQQLSADPQCTEEKRLVNMLRSCVPFGLSKRETFSESSADRIQSK